MSQLARQWAILCHLVPPHGPITVSELYQKLSDHFPASKRTYERDLLHLADTFPQAVISEDGGGDNGRTTYWSLRSRRGLIPEVLLNDADIAMALVVLEQQAHSRLPRSVMQRLQKWWEQAHGTLAHAPDIRLDHYRALIRYLPDSLRPVPPTAPEAIQLTVEQALMEGQALRLTRDTLDGAETLTGLVPLRLLLLEEVMYLLAEHPKAESAEARLCKIPLHRVTHAQCIGLATGRTRDPDLAQQEVLGTGGQQPIEMVVSREVAEMLFERPMGHNQILTPLGNGHYRLTTTLDDSHQLRHVLAQNGGMFSA
ncbi:WYL domain-containing protein [Vreelandella massiliensis]|uniref:WYL domain-containing protein n=1 Tax=Vreelandella massiliensis TaxID=1816686 RepID=UPI00096A9714|nr:WYL domain-containing protein [Halomonas massiliensis]